MYMYDELQNIQHCTTIHASACAGKQPRTPPTPPPLVCTTVPHPNSTPQTSTHTDKHATTDTHCHSQAWNQAHMYSMVKVLPHITQPHSSHALWSHSLMNGLHTQPSRRHRQGHTWFTSWCAASSLESCGINNACSKGCSTCHWQPTSNV